MTDEAVDRYLAKCRFGEYIYAELKHNTYLFGIFILTWVYAYVHRQCVDFEKCASFNFIFHRKYAPDEEGRENRKKPKRLILQIGDLFGSSGCSFIERSMTDYNYVKRVTTKQARAFKKKETERGDNIEDDSDSEEENEENDDGIDSDENGSEPDKQPTDVEKFVWETASLHGERHALVILAAFKGSLHTNTAENDTV